LLETKVNFQN